MSSNIKKHKLRTVVDSDSNSIDITIKGALSKQSDESKLIAISYCTKPMIEEFVGHFRTLLSHLPEGELPSTSHSKAFEKLFQDQWQTWLSESHPARRTAFVPASKSQAKSTSDTGRRHESLQMNLHPTHHKYNDGTEAEWKGPSLRLTVEDVASRVWADDESYQELAFDVPPMAYCSPATREVIVGFPPTIRNRYTGIAWPLSGEEGIFGRTEGSTLIQQAILDSLVENGYPLDVTGSLNAVSTNLIHQAISECVSKHTSTVPREFMAGTPSKEGSSRADLPQITLIDLKAGEEASKGSYYHQALTQTTDHPLPVFRLELKGEPQLRLETKEGRDTVVLSLETCWNGFNKGLQESGAPTIDAFRSAHQQCLTTTNVTLGNQKLGKDRSFSDLTEDELKELKVTLAWEVYRSSVEDFNPNLVGEAAAPHEGNFSLKSDRQLDFNERPLFELQISVQDE